MKTTSSSAHWRDRRGRAGRHRRRRRRGAIQRGHGDSAHRGQSQRAGLAALARRADRPARRHRDHPVRHRHALLRGHRGQPVLGAHPRQRDEVAGRRAAAGHLRLDRRRQPGQLRRGAPSARARAHAGVAQPAAELADQGVANGTISNSQLRDLLHQHITTEVTRYRGRIWQWDVVNEIFTDANPSQLNPNDFWISHLGPGIIADAFRWAHAADPHALLCYNDYNIAGEDGSNAKFDAAYAVVKDLLAQSVPIDCVGDQGHLDTQFGFSGSMTPGPAGICQPRPEGRDHRGGRPHVRRQRDRPGADGPAWPPAPSRTSSRDAAIVPGCAGSASRSPSGALPTRTRGYRAPSPVRATPTSTT